MTKRTEIKSNALRPIRYLRLILASTLLCAALSPILALASEPSANQVFARLTDRYTEAQREAYFSENAAEKNVRWTMKIIEVTRGWWNFDIVGDVGRGNTVLCKIDISEATTKQVTTLAKGKRITCAGTIKGYIRLMGTTIMIDDATVE